MLRKPSPALLIAVIALFVALGGTVYAGSKISGKSIKKGSEPGNRIKRDTITGRQVKESSLGEVPKAANATVGAPLAYGRVTDPGTGALANGATNLTSSKANTAGRYCFTVTDGSPTNVQVTLDWDKSPGDASAPAVSVPAEPVYECPAGTEFSVGTYRSGIPEDMGFFVAVW
jgi:hypothetical protein